MKLKKVKNQRIKRLFCKLINDYSSSITKIRIPLNPQKEKSEEMEQDDNGIKEDRDEEEKFVNMSDFK